MLAEVVRFDRLAAAHLSRRELYRARQLVAKAWEKLEAAAARAPLAQGLDGDMRLRLRFLNRRHAELERIQDLAYEAAEPGPGGTASLRVEASGELYRSVMGPGGDGLEVEGEVFCRRLAWVLGRETQLAGQEGGTLHLTVAAVPGGN